MCVRFASSPSPPLFFIKKCCCFQDNLADHEPNKQHSCYFFFSPVAERKRLVLTPYVGGHFRSSSAPVAKYRLGIPGRPCCPLSPRSCHFFLRFSRKVQNKSSLLNLCLQKMTFQPTQKNFCWTVVFFSHVCIFQPANSLFCPPPLP